MLKKYLSVSFCLLAFSSLNAETENLQVGRYQMVGFQSGTIRKFYLLDTATGHVWKSTASSVWKDDDSWVLQIATDPQHPEM